MPIKIHDTDHFVATLEQLSISLEFMKNIGVEPDHPIFAEAIEKALETAVTVTSDPETERKSVGFAVWYVPSDKHSISMPHIFSTHELAERCIAGFLFSNPHMPAENYAVKELFA